MGFTNILGLLSGVAMFLFGMTLMSDGLKRISGERLEPILFKLSGTPLRGVLLGAAVTTVIQSSSATSVMTVGFVNSGMMKLRQAIPVILGAILGTSITGWIVCLSYIEGAGGIGSILSTTTLTGIIAVVGVLLRVFSKKQSHHNIGDIMMGFAVLMFGMSTMSGSVRDLGDQPWFTSMLTATSNPILGILVGIFFAALLQSASAAVGIVQALSVTGAMTFQSTFPLLLGISVGASLPVMLTALNASTAGKRTALSYLLSCAIGIVFCAILFYGLNTVMHFPVLAKIMNPFSLALANTLMRLVMICLLLPFVPILEKIVMRVVPDKEVEAEEEEVFLPQLESRFLSHPVLAIEQSRSVILDMAVQASDSVTLALGLFGNFNDEDYRRVCEIEVAGDRYEDALALYLTQLSKQPLTAPQSQSMSIFLHTLSDIERISDHARNIAEIALEAHKNKTQITQEGKHELTMTGSAIKGILELTIEALVADDPEMAERVEPFEEVIDNMCDIVKLHHVSRLQRGECTVSQGYMLNDLLVDFERISDHCSNIAVAIVELHAESLASHEYLDKVKEMHSPEFERNFNEFRTKYAL